MIKKRLGVNIDHVATIRNARDEIYPNPSQNYFYINTDANFIEIYDFSGRIIMSEEIEKYTRINRDGITDGLYLYRLFNKEKNLTKTGKIIFN